MLYYFSFPKDEVRKKLWLKACKIKLCLPSNKICGDHFLPKHYSHSGYLLKNAVPFLASTSTGMYQYIYCPTLFAFITSQSNFIN